ncbi:MAG: DNA-directed RNA polymerase subunit beta', partial [Robiginitomaculum sp.]|nr:DNA-directed RNA polymerase subunit beta' [Robiginitomaculum sp.]
PEVWDILDEVIREHPVLLNRAPTLHRLGIQAFEPKLIEGKAIQLHPLVCTAFNADFDGDQMAVHVPLSMEAQLEARVLMMSTNNILSPSNGKPIIVPSQDIILGLYFLSLDLDKQKGEGMVLGGLAEIEAAMHAGYLDLHAKIKARYTTKDEDGNAVSAIYDTTPGRFMVADIMPRHPKVPFSMTNDVLTKKAVSDMIDVVYRHCGQKATVIFCDQLMGLGFREAARAGISFGKDDMIIPDEKKTLVAETRKLVADYEHQYSSGLITRGEKYNKVVDAWSKCTDKIADAMMDTMQKPKKGVPAVEGINSVFMMAHSGARGSKNQMKQLAGMRGLMAKPSGEIIETPIISNFKEGLSVSEYFSSTHGARKGLADTALKTANSGYLTRRLVDVAQDSIVRENDCGTDLGIEITPVINAGEVVVSIGERVLGRVCAEDILHPETNDIIAAQDTYLEENLVAVIDAAEVLAIKVRSPLTCETKSGICAACYGRDLARGVPVSMGEAVGVIAAQSIGEPGTQLTMRTFHIGGAAQVSEQSFIETAHEGKLVFENRSTVTDANGVMIVLSRSMKASVVDGKGKERESYKLLYGSKLLVDKGVKVKRGQRLSEWDPYSTPIITEAGGVVKLLDVVDGLSVKEETDEATGINSRVIVDWRSSTRGATLQPKIAVLGEDGEPVKMDGGKIANYVLAVGAILSVEDGDVVAPGAVIARIPNEGAKNRDITGGLPRVAELFEARKPKDHAILADIDGKVEFGRDYKNKRKIFIVPEDEDQPKSEFLVPKGKHMNVQDGDMIKRGEALLDGNPAPHDILQILGVEALAKYLVTEIQDVYRLQGVPINDKHIEVIVRQMLQKVEIIDGGGTDLLKGEQLDRIAFDRIQEKAKADKLVLAKAKSVLLGITKASLQTNSFISAASFQETTRVLTQAAVEGKSDNLEGLKENVIVGRLIPAGTGAAFRVLQRVADERDAVELAAREAEKAAQIEPLPDEIAKEAG